jgi:hypothetical protein
VEGKTVEPLERANDVVEQQLDGRLATLEEVLAGDVLVLTGPILPQVDEQVREIIERRPPTPGVRKLVVLLETGGGSVGAVERMSRLFRHHYAVVEYIVPNYAFSAGTVLVMSGDKAYMDYFSVLGPIDPQVSRRGQPVPASGYLIQYGRLIDKSSEGKLSDAELHYLIANFDPAEMYRYEQEKELTRTLLIEWLVDSNLIDWSRLRAEGKKVTKKRREARATEIAEALGDTDCWHSHGRGISILVLRRKLGLVIHDLEEDALLNEAVRAYYTLLRDYMMRLGSGIAMHVKGSYRQWRLS